MVSRISGAEMQEHASFYIMCLTSPPKEKRLGKVSEDKQL